MWGANRIRYPGSPHCKRWILGVGNDFIFCAVANAISIPPGEYGRKVETLKGIDGGPHKQWSMWFNSKQREEPYQGLTYTGIFKRLNSSSESVYRWCMVVVSSCREMLG